MSIADAKSSKFRSPHAVDCATSFLFVRCALTEDSGRQTLAHILSTRHSQNQSFLRTRKLNSLLQRERTGGRAASRRAVCCVWMAAVSHDSRHQRGDPGVHDAALRYFQAVAEEGSIRRASERVNVSPSAVNRQILKLEDFFGSPLFERHVQGDADHGGRAPRPRPCACDVPRPRAAAGSDCRTQGSREWDGEHLHP